MTKAVKPWKQSARWKNPARRPPARRAAAAVECHQARRDRRSRHRALRLVDLEPQLVGQEPAHRGHDAAKDYLREHWPNIRAQLLEGTYQPQPVKRVEIPKPDGGIRKLGVPPDSCRLEETATLRGVSAPVRFLRVAVGDVTDRVRPVHRVTKDARLSAGHRARPLGR